MKKLIIILLIGIYLVGCSANNTGNNGQGNVAVNDPQGNVVVDDGNNSSDPVTEPVANKTKVAINEAAMHEDVSYTVTSVEYSDGEQFDTPAEGKQYVVVTVLIENKSAKEISYNSWDWSMVNSMGQKDGVAFTIIDSDTSLSSGDLMPNGSISGTLVFEEPTDDPSLTLLYYANVIFDDKPTLEFVIR